MKKYIFFLNEQQVNLKAFIFVCDAQSDAICHALHVWITHAMEKLFA
jgi:hypothetical protein